MKFILRDMLEKLAEILEIAPTDFFTDPPPPIPGRPSENESALDALDVVVGLRLCARRRSLGLSQRKLGEAIGVSFRQIQKYERGMTRIAVATLVRVAAELDAPLSFFLEGVGPQRQEPEQETLHGRDASIAQALAKIEDRRVRAAFRTLIRALTRPV